MIAINLYYGFAIKHNGRFEQEPNIFINKIGSKIYSQGFSATFLTMYLSLLCSLKIWKNLPHFLSISSLLYSPSPSFFILIPSFMCFVFFSSTSFSMSCLYLIRQPFVLSGLSFPNVMMSRDFYGFCSYSDQLSNIKCICVRQVVVDLSGSSR